MTRARERMPWAHALRHAGVAIGAPYAVALLIVLALVGLSSPRPGDPSVAGMALVGAIVAAASFLALALLARRRPPRSRMIAFGQALLACLLAILAVLVATGAATVVVEAASPTPARAPFALPLLSITVAYAVAVVALLGTPLWVGAGVVAAAPLLGLPPRPELRVPGAIGAGLALALLAAVTMLAGVFRSPAEAASEVCAAEAWAAPHGAVFTGAWSWFPLGWRCAWDGVGTATDWWPTFALGWGLGGLALGLALWAANRPARPRTEVPQLPDEESIFP